MNASARTRPSLKALTVTSVVLVSAMTLAACGSSSSSSSSSAAASSAAPASSAASSAAAKDPIIIGAALGLSGGFATYDGEPLNAAKLYIDKVNASGGIDGRQVEVVTADTKSVATNGPTAVKEVIDQGASIVLVSCDFDMGSPAAAAANAAGVVSFSVCAGSNLFGPTGIGDLAYTIGTPAAVEGASAAQFAWDKGWKTAYTLIDNSTQFQKEYADSFVKAYTDLGGQIVGSDTFLGTDTTISTQIAKLKSTSPAPDALLLAAALPVGATAVQELRSSGVKTPIIAPIGMDGTSWLAQVPGLKDFYYTSYASQRGDDTDPAVNEITTAYTNAYGAAPTTAFAYMGWALMQVLQEGITKAGTTDGKALADSLNQLSKFPTVVGPTTFTPETHISYVRSFNMNEDANGKSTVVAKVTPSSVPGAPTS